jgi:hypothetical protein
MTSFNQISESTIAYVMMQENLLLESRLDYLKANTHPFDMSHDATREHHSIGAIVDHFANNADPTVNKQHTQYALGLYKNKAIRQEDAYKVKDALTTFEKYKHKLAPADKNMTVKNYPTVKSITDKMQPFEGTHASKAEEKKSLTTQGHDLKYEDDHIKVYHLGNKTASQEIYGGGASRGGTGTDWCTAARSKDCRFDDYHKRGKLHVVHRKSDGAVFQYHAHEDQFMDKHDETIKPEDFKSIAPSLHKAWKQDPSLLD